MGTMDAIQGAFGPKSVAVPITGHKIRSVLERYNIVDEADLADAASKLHQNCGRHAVTPCNCCLA